VETISAGTTGIYIFCAVLFLKGKGIDEIGEVLVALPEKEEVKIKCIPLFKMGLGGGGRLNHKRVRG